MPAFVLRSLPRRTEPFVDDRPGVSAPRSRSPYYIPNVPKREEKRAPSVYFSPWAHTCCATGGMTMDAICCALALLGGVIGAGFASGREIAHFFAAHGRFAPAAVLTASLTLAALFCLLAYLLRGHYREHPLDWKAIPGGIFLGLMNSGCTALMMKALGVMDAAVFFPCYNVGVVLVTLLTGIFAFREKLRGIQFAGIATALAAMVLLLTI